uniref:baseplate J/gp47 family protein n=1 Tax=Aeromonas rivuli TaxID=648794 RepID=UPI000693513A
MNEIPLSDLPEPQVIEPDYVGTLTRLKKNYELGTGHYPLASDPETFLLEQTAYERELLVDDINREGKQNLLAFADDAMLDNLGALVDCHRLPAGPAMTRLQLTLRAHPDTVLDAVFTVRAIDGATLFSTTQPVALSASATTVEVDATCQSVGTVGNGFLAGEITEIVSAHPYVASAVNIVISQGGSEIEDDERYRYRIYLAPSKFSVAGPYDAYEYWALTANGNITAVGVWSPLPNDISVCPLMMGGEPPTQAIADAVLEVLSDDKVRPLGDRVSIDYCEKVEALGTFTLEVFSDYQTMATTIQNQFEVALNAMIATMAKPAGARHCARGTDLAG